MKWRTFKNLRRNSITPTLEPCLINIIHTIEENLGCVGKLLYNIQIRKYGHVGKTKSSFESISESLLSRLNRKKRKIYFNIITTIENNQSKLTRFPNLSEIFRNFPYYSTIQKLADYLDLSAEVVCGLPEIHSSLKPMNFYALIETQILDWETYKISNKPQKHTTLCRALAPSIENYQKEATKFISKSIRRKKVEHLLSMIAISQYLNVPMQYVYQCLKLSLKNR